MVIIMQRLVYGVAINDAPKSNRWHKYDSSVPEIVKIWKGMLQRCYCENYKARWPSYCNKKVCEEWLLFSNFREWVKSQDWKGKQLDKDLIIKGNTLYHPDFCVFIDRSLNLFLTDNERARGKWPIGVYFDRRIGKFKAQCCNPFTGKKDFLGDFKCSLDGHKAWAKRKHELAQMWAIMQADKRVSDALNRYDFIRTTHCKCCCE